MAGKTAKPKAATTDSLGTFLGALEGEVTEKIETAVAAKSKEIDDKLAEITSIAKSGATLHVEVGDLKGKVEGVRHYQLEQLIQIAANRLPVLMVGMAGTGKTHSAEQVAEALKLSFYAISVGAQTSKSDIIGYMNATGVYVQTLFREAYEKGGVFLMDEIDAGNANVLIQVNAALSNNYCAFPDGMVKRHKDFIFIASANTFGNGANRQYVGRNQLDAATLDRFVVMEWFIDPVIEKHLAGTTANGKKWYAVVDDIRQKVEKEGLRVLVTPRATLRGAKLLAAGAKIEEVTKLALLNTFPQDKKDWAQRLVDAVWGRS